MNIYYLIKVVLIAILISMVLSDVNTQISVVVDYKENVIINTKVNGLLRDNIIKVNFIVVLHIKKTK